MFFQVLVDAVRAAPAGVQQSAQIVRRLQQRRLVAAARCLHHLLGHLGELPKGLIRQQRRAHALPQRAGEPGGADRAGQEVDGVQQRLAPVAAPAPLLAPAACSGATGCRRRWPAASLRRGGWGTAGRTARRGRWSAGVSGSSLRRTRWPSSPRKCVRGAKPKSANSVATSTSRQKRPSRSATRVRWSSLRSSTLSRWRRRSTGVGRLRDSPSSGARRSHSVRRTSHRWRSASGAFGSAALSSAVRSQDEILGRGKAVLLNAGRRSWSNRTPAPPRRRAARPRSCRRRCRAWCRAACRCASSWCIRNARPA